MRTSLDDFHLLCRIIETGRLRAAAEEIRTDPSNVTRRLSGLEDRLGVRLINRSRVRSTATDVGQRYYSELKNLLEQLEALWGCHRWRGGRAARIAARCGTECLRSALHRPVAA